MSQIKASQHEPAIQLTSIAIEENQATGIATPRTYHQEATTQAQTISHKSGIASATEQTSSTVELGNGIEEIEVENGNSNTVREDDQEYPEKNIKGWLVVFGAFCGLIPCWGIPNSIGVIQTQLLEHELKDVSTTTVSWIFSIFIGLTMGCSIFSGAYFDRNGARGPLIAGSLISVGSLLALGNCTEVYQFILSFAVGVGGGASIVTPALMGSVAQHFPKHKTSTVMSIAATGGSFGGVMFPAMLTKAYQTLGFQWSMRCVALISFVCLCISCVLVKEKQLPEKENLNTKGKLKLYLFKSFDLKAVVTDKRYFFNVCGCTLAEIAITITSGYFSFITVKSGFTESHSFLLVTVMNIFAVFGRYLSGYIADKSIGTFATLISLLLITGTLDLVIWLPFKSNNVGLWVYAVLYGFFFGGILSLLPSACSHIVRADEFGARYATMYGIAEMMVLLV
ncbi:unnamed protein product [Ambrosiozyma monospora]|uniref:Unnamed protein product n=1 Tax=Ambrosiozyma monospora TaxID=43982 RepID=A0ACB5T7X1_AMBMO|nr:unnamed protein product [Ambrosiozyma monospora]